MRAEMGFRSPGNMNSFFWISLTGFPDLTLEWAYHLRRSRVLFISVFVCPVCRLLFSNGDGSLTWGLARGPHEYEKGTVVDLSGSLGGRAWRRRSVTSLHRHPICSTQVFTSWPP